MATAESFVPLPFAGRVASFIPILPLLPPPAAPLATYGKSIDAKVIPGMHHSQPTSAPFVPVPGDRAKRLLVLGSRGFIGAHLAEAAASAGFEVVGAGRRPEPGVLPCDLLEPDSLAACLEAAAPDAIVNLAGSASVAASWRDPAAAFAANALGAVNLLEAVAEHRPGAHVTCVSSGQVYGDPGTGREVPFGEQLEPAPVSPYGAGKAAMEIVCGQYARGRGLRIATVRLFNQIGPGQSPGEAPAGFAAAVTAAEAAGEDRVEIPLGNPGAARDFLDVRDSARVLAEIAGREPTGLYNLCSGSTVPLRELIEVFAAHTELSVGMVEDPGLRRPNDPNVVYGDPSRLRREIGWEPAIGLDRSVGDLLEETRRGLAGAAR